MTYRREAICEHCGKVFWAKTKIGKYCSKECRKFGQAYYQHREELEKSCVVCNKRFLTYKKRQKYCSKECYKKVNKAASISYKTNHRERMPYLKIRFQVFERDKFRCHYCGRGAEDGVKLVVDHILPKKQNGQDELSNLITACEECNVGKGDILLLANKGQIPSFLSV